MSTAKRWLLTAVLLTGLLCPARVFAQAHDPTTVLWDVTITGVVKGLAQLAFSPDTPSGGSITGFLIVRPTVNIKPANVPSPLIFGSTPVSGAWTLDLRGGLIGFLSGGSSDLPIDLSLTGKVTTGVSLTLTGKGNGTWKMKGIPLTADNAVFDGTTWIAKVFKGTEKSFEMFFVTADICPDDPPPVVPADCVGVRFNTDNIYELYGDGPGYLTQGYIMVGGAGRIAFVLTEHAVDNETGIPDASGAVRAVSGTYKRGKTSSLIGSDGDHQVTMSAFSPDLLP